MRKYRVAASLASVVAFLAIPGAQAADCWGSRDIGQWHAILATAFGNDQTHQWTISPPLCRIMLLAPNARSTNQEVAAACALATGRQWDHPWLVMGYTARADAAQPTQPQCEVR